MPEINYTVEELNLKIQNLQRKVAEKETTASILQIERNQLKNKIELLQNENSDLKLKITTLQLERPKLSSKKLMSSFGMAINEMQNAFDQRKEDIKYFVTNLDIDLKANITESEDEIFYQLPKLDDVVPFENLSTIRIGIKAVPQVEKDIFEYNEVPDLLGIKQEEAERIIQKKGFTLGEIDYELSNVDEGTIIEQLPSPLSVAKPESPIDLTLSTKKKVNIPNLVGMSFEDANKILEDLELNLGSVTERTSSSEEGTVISQSLIAGKEMEIGTSIDLVLAKSELSEVPVLVGLSIENAREILDSGEWKYKVKSEKVDDLEAVELADVHSVIGQTPKARTLVKKDEVEIEISAILSPISIIEIDGIGKRYTERLEVAGIKTIGELSFTPTTNISKGARVSEKVAKDWKSMATLYNDAYFLTGVEGIGKDEAELLVKAGNIKTIDELKKAEPNTLYETLKTALDEGKVRVPQGFKLEQENVSKWVEIARTK